jgi:cold shock CspA family protein
MADNSSNSTIDASNASNPANKKEDVILNEVADDNRVGKYIGICKWFNNVYGYGFITIWDGEEKGKDIFVHHSGIKPLNSQYKTLKKGEYMSFDIVDGDKGLQAVNVRGINGGPLLCDQVVVKRGVPPPPPYLSMPPTEGGWNTVNHKGGAKRGRNTQQQH